MKYLTNILKQFNKKNTLNQAELNKHKFHLFIFYLQIKFWMGILAIKQRTQSNLFEKTDF